MTKIVIDVFGADDPAALLRGVAEATHRYPDVTLLIPGDPDTVLPALREAGADPDRYEVLPATEIITNEDSPAEAVMKKRDSSLVVGLAALKGDPDAVGMIAAGNTGAVLVGAALRLGRLPGVTFPTLASVFCTLDGGSVCLLDCGANVDTKPEVLPVFARLGAALMSSLGCSEPRVGLLSIGVEEKKGNAYTKEVFPLLRESGLHFIGNVEGCDILTGKCDVVVTDGFVGNVLLKALEGAGKFALATVRRTLREAGCADAIADAAIKEAMHSVDYTAEGGGVLLGVKKPIVKIHGASGEATVSSAVAQLLSYTSGDFIAKQSEALTNIN